jgi:hypothetical protein
MHASRVPPSDAALGRYEKKWSVASAVQDSKACDVARSDSCGFDTCGHGSIEVQLPRFGPRKCTKDVNELRKNFVTHLVVACPDVRSDVGEHLARVSARRRGQRRYRLARQGVQGTAPTRMHNGDRRARSNEHDRNAVGEAQHQGRASGSGQGVGCGNRWTTRGSSW